MNREKVKQLVENMGGEYVAPDGRGKPTGVATAKFILFDKAGLFIEKMGKMRVPCHANFLDFDCYIVYFLEKELRKN